MANNEELAALAAEQQQNPNNPYLQNPLQAPGMPEGVLLPGQSNPFTPEREANRSPNASVLNASGEPTPGNGLTPQPAAGLPPGIAKPVPEETSVPPGIARPQEVPGATPVAKAGGGGGPAGPSAIRTWEQDRDKTDQERIGLLEQSAAARQHAQDLRSQGISTRDDELAAAEIRKRAEDAGSKQRWKDFDKDTQTKDADDEFDRQRLRQMHEDPSKWFKDRGVAGSILAAISMAAGAFAAARSGGKIQNYAMDIITKSIDKDVEAQHANIQSAWKGHEAQVAGHQKDFVKQHYINQRKDEAYLNDYSHAIALATQHLASTTDQAEIDNTKALIDELKAKQLEVKDNVTDRKLLVHQKETAEANSAATKNSVSPKERLGMVNKYIEQGYGAKEASDMADYVISGGKSGADHPGLKSGKGDKDNSYGEASLDFRDALKDPVLNEIGIVAGAFGNDSPRIAPGSAATTTAVDGLNIRMNSTIGKDLKDSEGRISPQLMEALHKTDILPGDTKEQAQNKIQQKYELSKSIGRQAGVHTPATAR